VKTFFIPLNFYFHTFVDLFHTLGTFFIPFRPGTKTQSHEHSGFVEKSEEAMHSSPRRAAEDTLVTSQHDVPHWALGQ